MKHDPSLTDLRALFGADEFHARHIGPGGEDETRMLAAIGYASRRDLIRDTVPASILREAPLAIVEPTTEAAALAYAQANGLIVEVVPLGPKTLKIQAYSDNFR